MVDEFNAIFIRYLRETDLDSVRGLTSAASLEGFQFLDRFIHDLQLGSVQLNHSDEFFLCVLTDGQMIGLGGVTRDPYLENNSSVGRIRHVYVRPEWRGVGVGTRLIREIERLAKASYSSLRLRTDTSAAARFYESIGYRCVPSSSATHERSW